MPGPSRMSAKTCGHSEVRKMRNFSWFVVLIVLLWLAANTNQSFGANPTGGRDFDIVNVSAKEGHVSVEICSRSQRGLDGPLLILCKTGKRETLKKRVHFNSGECKTVHFSLPKTQPNKIIVSIHAEDVGKFGSGWWQFDSWEGAVKPDK